MYVQRDTLLLADVFDNFRNECTEIYELWISMASLFKKKKVVKLELLTNVDMLLMAEKGIRGEICHAIHRYAKANNNCMKNYDQNKESSYIQYLDVSNL